MHTHIHIRSEDTSKTHFTWCRIDSNDEKKEKEKLNGTNRIWIPSCIRIPGFVF